MGKKRNKKTRYQQQEAKKRQQQKGGSQLYMGRKRKRETYQFVDDKGIHRTVYIAAYQYKSTQNTCLVLVDNATNEHLMPLTINTDQALTWDEVQIPVIEDGKPNLVDWMIENKILDYTSMMAKASIFPHLQFAEPNVTIYTCCVCSGYMADRLVDGPRSAYLRKEARYELSYFMML